MPPAARGQPARQPLDEGAQRGVLRRGHRPGRAAAARPWPAASVESSPHASASASHDPLGRDVGVGVGDVERHVADDEVRDTGPLGARRRDAVHPAQEERVVSEEQVGPELARLLDDGEGGVDGEVHPAHRLLRVAGDETDPVPRLGRGRRVEALDDLEHLAQGQVGASVMWARPGSNRRPTRCKRGALPAELQAPDGGGTARCPRRPRPLWQVPGVGRSGERGDLGRQAAEVAALARDR